LSWTEPQPEVSSKMFLFLLFPVPLICDVHNIDENDVALICLLTTIVWVTHAEGLRSCKSGRGSWRCGTQICRCLRVLIPQFWWQRQAILWSSLMINRSEF
jgi:hypothetical protein